MRFGFARFAFGGFGRRGSPFAALAEAVLQSRIELLAKFGVLGAELGDLAKEYIDPAEKLADQILQRANVVGKGRIEGESGGVHAR